MKADVPKYMTLTWDCPDCAERNEVAIPMTQHGLTKAHKYLCCADCDSRLKIQVVGWHTPSLRKAGPRTELVF